MRVRYLSLADTERLGIPMREVVPAVEEAFRMVATGRSVVAKRTRLVHPMLPAASSGEGRPWTRDVRIIPGGIEGVGFGVRVGTALRRPGRHPDGASGVVLLFFDWETMALRGAISDRLVHAVRSTAPNEEVGADVLRDARWVTTYRAGTLDHVPPYPGLADLIASGEWRGDELVELSDVVAGSAVGRDRPDRTVVCFNPAFGVLDAAVAAFVMDRAERAGIGTELAP